MDNDKLIADLQRIAEMFHENNDAVKWATEMMRYVMKEYTAFADTNACIAD